MEARRCRLQQSAVFAELQRGRHLAPSRFWAWGREQRLVNAVD